MNEIVLKFKLNKMGTQKTWHEKHHSTLSYGGRIADAVAKGMGSCRRWL